MSITKVDTFVLIVHFLNDKWEPYHVTIGFFEIVETFVNATNDSKVCVGLTSISIKEAQSIL
jgi:hypothetical protein